MRDKFTQGEDPMKKSLARISLGLLIVAALLLVNPISKSKPEAFAVRLAGRFWARPKSAREAR